MRVSSGALVLVAVVGCYRIPQTDFPDSGSGLGGIGGTAGAAEGDGGPDADCSAIPMLPAAPTLRRPMRGAYSGSLHAPASMATLRPTFSWAAVTPTCGAVSYEIQVDDSCTPGQLDACTFPSPEMDT